MMQFFHCAKGYAEDKERRPGGWVNIDRPDKDDLIYLVENLKMPAAFLEALSDIDERPRFDHEGDWSMTILRIPTSGSPDGVPYRTVPLGILTKDDYIVTLCYFKSEIISDFIAYSQRRELSIKRVADFVLHMLFSSTYWYLTYLKQMSRAVTSAERDMENSVKNRDLINLMGLQQSLTYFNTSLRGNQVLLERLQRVYGDNFDHDLYDDLEVEMKQADNTISVYSDILESTMDAVGSIISNNVNQVMKRMTSITIVLMVPTLIASFYGMNVEGLTFAALPFSFYIVILVALLSTIATYLWLRHIKWF